VSGVPRSRNAQYDETAITYRGAVRVDEGHSARHYPDVDLSRVHVTNIFRDSALLMVRFPIVAPQSLL